ncbi:hypothetical protein L3X38_002382 [Prunus dulcis]|uniref:Putative E3 ubiquitin-protein ligase LIN ARM repeats domain-containing protein n=1 Tax=Prunus dulcis TaxID=3755 RepID=A0AAD4ZKP7_PRUDU|nr:hypothetical protein L3X38_002382 [Prunus dulcis]
MILDQLVAGISTSKEEMVIRASVSILTSIVAANKSAIEDIKKKGPQLSDLASALKRDVHEAAILYKGRSESLPTPLTASLMIIEVLVTAFDHCTNNMHLAEISSPKVLHGLSRKWAEFQQEAELPASSRPMTLSYVAPRWV